MTHTKFFINIALLLSAATLSMGQQLIATPTNLIPRIGETVEVEFSFPSSSDDSFNPGPSNAFLIQANFLLNPDGLVSGWNKFAPLSLTWQGTEITSGSFAFRIFPTLPYIKSGIWINQVVVQNGENTRRYLILEQYAPLDEKSFAEINLEFFKSTVLKLYKENQLVEQRMLMSDLNDPFSDAMDIQYIQTVYQIGSWGPFSDFIFDEKHLINKPKDVRFDEYTISHDKY